MVLLMMAGNNWKRILRDCYFQYFAGSLRLTFSFGSHLNLHNPLPTSSNAICSSLIILSLIKTSFAIGEITMSAITSGVSTPSTITLTLHVLGDIHTLNGPPAVV